MVVGEEDLTNILLKVRMPASQDRIHKNKCHYSNSTIRSDGGLFVDLNSFYAFGKDHVHRNYRETGNQVYLQIQQITKPGSEDTQHEDKYNIVTLPSMTKYEYSSSNFPSQLNDAVGAVLKPEALKPRKVCKYVNNLSQVQNPAALPLSGWKCEHHGYSDIYSFDDGASVHNPSLKEHLAHFGISSTSGHEGIFCNSTKDDDTTITPMDESGSDNIVFHSQHPHARSPGKHNTSDAMVSAVREGDLGSEQLSESVKKRRYEKQPVNTLSSGQKIISIKTVGSTAAFTDLGSGMLHESVEKRRYEEQPVNTLSSGQKIVSLKTVGSTAACMDLLHKSSSDSEPSSYHNPIQNLHPLFSSFNKTLRPILDTINSVCSLIKDEEELIPPTILVIGVKSAGKSSVIESLTGIPLSGISTRVPLIIELKSHGEATTNVVLDGEGLFKTIVNESSIREEINELFENLVVGESTAPVTLKITKNGFPDVRIIELPGIDRSPLSSETGDIHARTVGLIMDYLKDAETIIINVHPANVEITMCESLEISHKFDGSGMRTLTVLSKVDLYHDELAGKLILGEEDLNWFLVANLDGDKEARVFEKAELLHIDKSRVGVGSLAEKIVQIMLYNISKQFPSIREKVKTKIAELNSNLKKLPKPFANASEALLPFLNTVASLQETLRNHFIFHHVLEEGESVYKRLDTMLENLKTNVMVPFTLSATEEINACKKQESVRLPGGVPSAAAGYIIKMRVQNMYAVVDDFVHEICKHIRSFCHKVRADTCKEYPQFESYMYKPLNKMLSEMEEVLLKRTRVQMKVEEFATFTCFKEYFVNTQRTKESIIEQMEYAKGNEWDYIALEAYGDVRLDVDDCIYNLEEGYKFEDVLNLKLQIVAYWEVVIKRTVDFLTNEVNYRLKELASVDMILLMMEETNKPIANGTFGRELPATQKVRIECEKELFLLKEVEKVLDENMFVSLD